MALHDVYPHIRDKETNFKEPPPKKKTCCGSHNKIRQAFQQPNSGSIYHVEGILLYEDLELAVFHFQGAFSPAERKKVKARSS